MEAIPEINYCGNILNIYEKSDPFDVAGVARKEASSCDMDYFKEIELHTAMGNGFLFKSFNAWMVPTRQRAKDDFF